MEKLIGQIIEYIIYIIVPIFSIWFGVSQKLKANKKEKELKTQKENYEKRVQDIIKISEMDSIESRDYLSKLRDKIQR